MQHRALQTSQVWSHLGFLGGKDTHIRAYVHHTHTHTHTHTDTHTRTHWHTHTRTHWHTHIRTHARTHAHTHTCTHTHAHTHRHTHTDTYTHTHRSPTRQSIHETVTKERTEKSFKYHNSFIFDTWKWPQLFSFRPYWPKANIVLNRPPQEKARFQTRGRHQTSPASLRVGGVGWVVC